MIGEYKKVTVYEVVSVHAEITASVRKFRQAQPQGRYLSQGDIRQRSPKIQPLEAD